MSHTQLDRDVAEGWHSQRMTGWLMLLSATAVSLSNISVCRVMALTFLRICHCANFATRRLGTQLVSRWQRWGSRRGRRGVKVCRVWQKVMLPVCIVLFLIIRVIFFVLCRRRKKPRATSTWPTSWSTEPLSARRNSKLSFTVYLL